MRLKNIVLSSLALAVSVSAAAQETKTEYEFNPNWYVQGQFGGQYTLGEVSFGDLLSPNAQLSVGYNFTKIFGLRAGVNAWQSKAGWDDELERDWKWNYVAPTLDATFNLSNLICGYNPERLFNLGVFGGIGANIAFGNDEAVEVSGELAGLHKFESNHQSLRNLWDGTKTRFMARAGVTADFRITDNWSVGLELQATTLNDNYNSKMAKNADWYFNGLVGVKYTFGKSYTKKTVVVPEIKTPGETEVIERIVEKEVPGPVREIKVVEPYRQHVYFGLASAQVSLTEMQKIKDLAAFMEKYPSSKVSIVGHADKATGSASINMKLSKKRAQAISDILVNKYGIDASRITIDAVGDTEQPHSENNLNRVSICIAK